MHVKLLSTARVKSKKVQKDLLLAQADLHEANSDIAMSIDGISQPARESIAAAVEQSSAVEAQLNDAALELATVSELLRAAEVKLDDVTEQASRESRSSEGASKVVNAPVQRAGSGGDKA